MAGLTSQKNDLQQDSATPLPAAAPVVPAVVEKDDEMDKHSDRMSVDKPSVEIKQEDEDEWALLPKLPTGMPISLTMWEYSS